ncbi:MAG TPA: serine hydrolase domain-containing protein [Acidimicrobiia bacterium]|nr:serine hydrolase domain-containing protein [Acidimicrobiia bacterium]
MVLGVLVEEVTGATYADALRHQILEPLSLTDTYLSYFEQGAVPVEAFTFLGQASGRVVPVDFDYTSVATSAWATGGLVSTVKDVTTFFQSLASGEIISNALLEGMLQADVYGLGVEMPTDSDGVYGHSGGIPDSTLS